MVVYLYNATAVNGIKLLIPTIWQVLKVIMLDKKARNQANKSSHSMIPNTILENENSPIVTESKSVVTWRQG